jgi:hypothetical protein
MEKRGSHSNKDQQPLCQICEALLDHTFDVRLLLILLIWIGANTDDAKRGCVERRLWDETIREWDAEETGDSSHQTEKKKVPI